MNVLDIKLSNQKELFKMLTGRYLETIDIKNTFKKRIPRSYYQDNNPYINIGLVFKTSSNKHSKLYPIYTISFYEKGFNHGKYNFWAQEKTFLDMKKALSAAVSRNFIKFKIKELKLNKRSYQNEVKIILSTGSEDTPLFKYKTLNLDLFKKGL